MELALQSTELSFKSQKNKIVRSLLELQMFLLQLFWERTLKGGNKRIMLIFFQSAQKQQRTE